MTVIGVQSCLLSLVHLSSGDNMDICANLNQFLPLFVDSQRLKGIFNEVEKLKVFKTI